MKYRILSHTADLRLEVYGKTLEELFKNAAEALAEILFGEKIPLSHEKAPVEKITIHSTNQNALLVDFLNEILAKSQIKKIAYKVHKVIKLEDNEIETEISGMLVEKFKEDVKAITYHEADIKKEGKIWKTKLIMDV